jgi:RNA polymerase subunit RPABC4/transcription elongation factor Spt4
MENKDLQQRVKAVANHMQNGISGFSCEDCNVWDDHKDTCPICNGPMAQYEVTGWEYIADALDIEYTVASDKRTMLGASITMALGGPDIRIDTRRGVVEGFWGSDTAQAFFTKDPMGVAMAASDLYWAS